MKKDYLDVVKTIRLTKNEYEQIKQDAIRCGLPMSTYVRERALKHRPKGKDLTRAINQLAKQGGLLKHLHNNGLGYGKETARLLGEMRKTIRLLSLSIKAEQEKEDAEAQPYNEVIFDYKQNSEEEGRR